MCDSGALAALSAGSIWVDLTTSRPELIQRLANEAPPSVTVVDLPVTGAVDGARNGTLALFAGGDAETVERVRPLLRRLGRVAPYGDLETSIDISVGRRGACRVRCWRERIKRVRQEQRAGTVGPNEAAAHGRAGSLRPR
ncbi:NAD(P)-binding domain-containing protein [Candidatus Poriferisodalis sp.]|uniref:NAD(P)-binding domain-containing protein n=1 Tax=Candidatus Poriferisodalis sp. TaxID=3101277 RepID=UPI003B01BC8A